jgi:hypothetical protein
MARSAKNLLKELKSEGWAPGKDITQTETFAHLSEACGCDTEGHAIEGAKRELHLGDDADGFRIRDLYENLVVTRSTGEPVGRTFINDYMDPQHPRHIMEEGGAISAVDSTAFAGITGQLMVTQVLEPFQREEFMARKMMPTYASPLVQEKWIGLATPKDPGKNALRVAEGEPFKMFGFGEEYVQTPPTRKYGGIIGLTKEAVFFDRTGQITDRAQDIGYLMALYEEKEALGVMIGGTTDPTYFIEKRQFDSAPVNIDLFQAATGSTSTQLYTAYNSRPYPFVNEVPNNPLNDYKAIEAGDKYFTNTVDPNTGEPIVVGKPFVFVSHTQRVRALQIFQAENIAKITQAGLTTIGSVATISPNVLSQIGMTYANVVTSRQLKAQMVAQLGLTLAQADDVWFYGDPTEAFRWVQNWPVAVIQAPSNSEAEFNQDIIMRWKASAQGRAAIRNPRVWQRNNYATEASSI